MLIYYFTRTGRSRQIAEALAKEQGTNALPITDGKNWSGTFGYIRAGAAAMMGKGLPATFESPAEGERVAVVFPVWAGKFPPAVKTFVQEVGCLLYTSAFAVGMSLAFMEAGITESIMTIGTVTFVLSALGVMLGKALGTVFRKKAVVIGGIVLILIGIKMLF